MFEKLMHYLEWCLLVIGIVITGFTAIRTLLGLALGTICLGRTCVTKALQPDVYWIFMVMYIVAIPVMVNLVNRSWKTIISGGF